MQSTRVCQQCKQSRTVTGNLKKAKTAILFEQKSSPERTDVPLAYSSEFEFYGTPPLR